MCEDPRDPDGAVEHGEDARGRRGGIEVAKADGRDRCDRKVGSISIRPSRLQEGVREAAEEDERDTLHDQPQDAAAHTARRFYELRLPPLRDGLRKGMQLGASLRDSLGTAAENGADAPEGKESPDAPGPFLPRRGCCCWRICRSRRRRQNFTCRRPAARRSFCWRHRLSCRRFATRRSLGRHHHLCLLQWRKLATCRTPRGWAVRCRHERLHHSTCTCTGRVQPQAHQGACTIY